MSNEVLAWPPVAGFREAVEARVVTKTTYLRSAFECPPTRALDVLGLSAVQRNFAWACAVATLDPLLYPHLVLLGGADARRGLTPATYAALVGLEEQDAIALAHWLDSDPSIVQLGLLTRSASGLLPIATPYRASARLAGEIVAVTRLDGRVERLGGIVQIPETVCRDDAQQAAVSHIGRALSANALVVVEGMRGVGRRTAIASAAAAIGRTVLSIDGGRIRAAELEENAHSVCADALLRGAIPVIADIDRITGAEPGECAAILARVLDVMPGPCGITTSTPGFDLTVGRVIRRVTLRPADVSTRMELWLNALGASAPPVDELREIALRHRLGAAAIHHAAKAARLVAGDGSAVTREAITAGIRDTVADRFGGLVERLSVDDEWDDMVLSPETRDQLQALVGRVRHAWTVFEEWRFPKQTARGGGVAALLSGPPGTGKSMVAGIIARELGRELYRVDLSQVISKWVGETEKQLAQVFDAAEAGNALLLFDEADSLFAKRTEVKSSSDRYANLEVNYLLQRIETFSGITILTTNLDTSIDPALRRRLAAHVVFWPPEHDERIALWERFLRTRAPIKGSIDFDELASDYPDMTGANIRNAALAAAFLAASDGGEIDQERVRRAARAEYRSMGRVLGGRK